MIVILKESNTLNNVVKVKQVHKIKVVPHFSDPWFLTRLLQHGRKIFSQGETKLMSFFLHFNVYFKTICVLVNVFSQILDSL